MFHGSSLFFLRHAGSLCEEAVGSLSLFPSGDGAV